MSNPKPKLTTAQQKVFDFICEYIKENQMSPSIREICEATNVTSTSTAHSHIKTLEKKGYIQTNPSKNRALQVNSNFRVGNLISVPILGEVTAGFTGVAEENITDYMELPEKMVEDGESFILRVRGNSMIEAGINDGDLVQVKKQNTARDGEIVVALIDGDEATVKKVYFEANGVRLQPCNPSYSPVVSKEVIILGKVVRLIRNY